MNLFEIIKERIAKNGPITIAEYMQLALSHPEFGYYMRKDPLGAQGDFTTSPEISQIFGELVGLWIARQWDVLGKPKAALVEFGPGRGTLMADALRATKKIPGFHEAVSVHLVETSPTLKQKQWNALAGKHASIEWHDSIDTLPKKPWLVIANEFFDALPIRQFIEKNGAHEERRIDYKEGRFVFTSSNGVISEQCDGACDIIKTLSAHFARHAGAALIIDYGYSEGGKGDTLQAVKHHAYHEILQNPGEADITAHVDFAALKKAAHNADAKTYGPVPQGQFLMRIGAGQRLQKLVAAANEEQSAALLSGLERLASPDQMGDLFKVLAITSSHIEHAEGF